jgi:hypothetical protein
VYPDEAAWWWRKLKISVTRDMLNLSELESIRIAQLTGIAQMFTADGVLMEGYYSAFLSTSILDTHARLALMIGKYQKQYEDLSLAASKKMRKVAVQANEDKVLVSGLSDELYLIGRLDADVLKLSSCYWVPDMKEKLEGRHKVLLWNLSAPEL